MQTAIDDQALSIRSHLDIFSTTAGRTPVFYKVGQWPVVPPSQSSLANLQGHDNTPPVELQSASNSVGDGSAKIPTTIANRDDMTSIMIFTIQTAHPIGAVNDYFEFEWFWILIFSIRTQFRLLFN